MAQFLTEAAKVAPWVSALIALASFFVAGLSLKIVRAQAREREAPLTPYVEDVWYAAAEDGGRRYTWRIRLTNPSSNSISIAQAAMSIRRRIENDATIDAQFAPRVSGTEGGGGGNYRIEPFDSKLFEFVFEIKNEAIPSAAVIAGQSIKLADSRGRVIEIAPSFIVKRET